MEKSVFLKRKWSNVFFTHTPLYSLLRKGLSVKQKGKCPVRLLERHLPVLYTVYAASRHESLREQSIRKRYDAQCSRRCQHPDKGSAMQSWLRLSFRRQ